MCLQLHSSSIKAASWLGACVDARVSMTASQLHVLGQGVLVAGVLRRLP